MLTCLTDFIVWLAIDIVFSLYIYKCDKVCLKNKFRVLITTNESSNHSLYNYSMQFTVLSRRRRLTMSHIRCCFWYILELLLFIFFLSGVAFFSNPRPRKNLEQWTVKKILWVSFIYTTSPKYSYFLDVKI